MALRTVRWLGYPHRRRRVGTGKSPRRPPHTPGQRGGTIDDRWPSSHAHHSLPQVRVLCKPDSWASAAGTMLPVSTRTCSMCSDSNCARLHSFGLSGDRAMDHVGAFPNCPVFFVPFLDRITPGDTSLAGRIVGNTNTTTQRGCGPEAQASRLHCFASNVGWKPALQVTSRRRANGIKVITASEEIAVLRSPLAAADRRGVFGRTLISPRPSL